MGKGRGNKSDGDGGSGGGGRGRGRGGGGRGQGGERRGDGGSRSSSGQQLPQQMQGMQIGGGRGDASNQQAQRYIPGMPPPRGQQQQQQQQQSGGSQSTSAPQPTGPTGAWGKPKPQQQQQQQPAQGQQAWRQRPEKESPAPQQQQQQQQQQQLSRKQEEVKDTVRKYDVVELPVTAIDVKTISDSEKKRLSSLIPLRKNVNQAGTMGRKIRVRTNMMGINFGSNFNIKATHYDIKFDPDKPKLLKRLAFNKLRELNFPNNWPAFDGRANVYSAGDLPFGNNLEAEVEIFDEERQQMRIVRVTLQKANQIDISWLKDVKPGLKEHDKDQTSMQVLDIILRCASYDKAIMVGRSFFKRPVNPLDLGNGMELWTGLFQSSVLGWKPYFNIDIAHKGFPKSQPVIDAMISMCGSWNRPCKELTLFDFNKNRLKIEQYLKTLKVVYQLPGKPSTKRTVGINGFDKSPDTAIFKLANGEVTTVLNYFSGSKGYKIKYTDIPCLWVGSRNKDPRILVPPELCTIIPGIVTNRKLDEQQTRNMIREASTKPDLREKKIMNAFNSMNFNDNPTMREFGISVTGKFAEVDARILQAPNLRDKKDIQVKKGVWDANQFYNATSIANKKWTILNLASRDVTTNKLFDFVEQLKGNKNGMDIGEPHTPFTNTIRTNDIRSILNYLQDMKKIDIKLVVVVIPGKFNDVYPKVKQAAELRVGIMTQCIKDVTINNKMNNATAVNILLKINSKLNGVNHVFHPQSAPACLLRPTMFIGADVTHPSPDAQNIPSIAAVAASFERTAFKYNVTIKLQPARQEIISDLTEIIFNQIRRFIDTNSTHANPCVLPEKIIYYRDGVSEGQFPQIMHFELKAIRDACTKIKDGYQPKITFLVVQKRHHIRLFPERQYSDGKTGNVEAGTVVDREITHPSHIDFYLVSHASIQGTARPTKYRCLWDDSNMSEDEIEQLTYYLCHMFSRCTRSVSYPAPTYYAHLAAFRARALIQDVPIQMSNLANEQRQKLTLNPAFHNNNPMFFV